jgi:hypothetical protein
MSESKDEPKGFKVVDRRSSRDGSPEPEPAPAAKAPAETAAPPSPEDIQPAPDPIDFGTFLVSLGSSAIFHLGEAPHPDSGQVEKNLPLARQTIDILALIQEKTRGNLTQDEGQLLESLLYDLRLRYVDASRGR